MDPCKALVEKLKLHPDFVCSELESGVRIEPPCERGFAVELHACGEEWMVYLGNAGFHQTFKSSEEALNFIAWCYSGTARVREIWRGNFPQKSVLETREVDRWNTVSQTGYIFVPYWRSRREVILENPDLLNNQSAH